MPSGGARWTRAEDLVGETLEGRYRLLRLLGEGGMGAVYEARHLRIDKQVAIKVLSPMLASEERHNRRFLREARAANKIRSPHVVEILDFGEEPTAFFVMEFLEGRDLARVVADEGPLPWSRTRGIVKQIVSALSAAHVEGIVHRDMKPANVFVRSEANGQDFVKVLDFGIAKVTESSPETRGITRTDEVVGTVAYMSPEQAMGLPVDLRTDIYAVGIIIYQMMAGAIPFDGMSAFQIMEQHVRREPPPLRRAMPSAPAEVEQVVLRCMAKEPAQRFQSMEELAFAIDQIPASFITTPGPPIPPPPLHAMPPQSGEVESTWKLGEGGELIPSSPEGRAPGTQILQPFEPAPVTEIEPEATAKFRENEHGPAFVPASPRPPVPAPARAPVVRGRDDYTITVQPRASTAKVVIAIVAGLVLAIGGGIAVALWLGADLDEGEDVATKTAVAKPAKEPEPTREPEVEPTKEPAVDLTKALEPEPTKEPEPAKEPEVEPEPEPAKEPEVEPTKETRVPKHRESGRRQTTPASDKTSDDALVRAIKKRAGQCKLQTPVAVSFQVMPSGKPALVRTTPSNPCVAGLVSRTGFATRAAPSRFSFAVN